VEYVQLAHNEWVDGKSRARVVHGFGRKDRLHEEALKRLISSISRYLDPDDAAKVRQDLGLEAPFEFLGAKQLGGTHLLDGLWQRLGIRKVLGTLSSWVRRCASGEMKPCRRRYLAPVATRRWLAA